MWRQKLTSAAWAEGTKRSYASAVKGFGEFCVRMDYNSLPTSGRTVALFLVHEFRRGLKYGSIVSALCAIKAEHRAVGRIALGSEVERTEVELTLRGIRRMCAERGDAVKKARALYGPELEAACKAARYLPEWGEHFRLIVQSSFAVCYAGLLRKSELLALQDADVSMLPRKAGERVRCELLLRRTKTSQYAAVRIKLCCSCCPGEIGKALTCAPCSVLRLRSFRNRNKVPTDGSLWGPDYDYPLFMSALRSSLRHAGSKLVKEYSTHSFRRGAATALDLAGTAPQTIKEMGRWKSEAYQNYLEYSWSQAAAGAAALFDYMRKSKRKRNNPDEE